MAMNDRHKWQLAALIVGLGFLLWLLGPVLTPFVIAALLAYLGDPLVDRLERLRLSRTGAVAIVFALMTLALVSVVLLLIPMLERQISTFIEQFPRYRDWFTGTALPWVTQRTGLDIEGFEIDSLYAVVQQHWQQAGGVAATLWGGISKSGLVILNWVVNLALIPVVAFYLLRDWDVMVEKIRQLVPRPIEPTVSRLARESDSVLGGFLRGQLSVMLALGTIYWIGLWMAGIDFALLIGMIAGLVSFIPYLGAIVGVGIGLIAALVQYGDWTHVILVCAVFGVGQMLESVLLTPFLVGDRIGMHPVAVIFAVMAGGQLFGFVGVLVALPVAAVAMVLLRYLYEQYTTSRLYAGSEHNVQTAGSSAEVIAARAERAASSKDEPAE
ncbi:AI-2E family transporter [Xanthomonadaceae bacterium XH05]|nr:AI-2E family transporter [Xanthomonadaceae bacterium XH05]